ncbi:MAG: LytTR family DNA-binding domain-containing protein [Flavobacteriales bacterium]
MELPIDEINYVESDGNYQMFYTNDKVYKSRFTVKQVSELLPESMFTQVHRAYIVNKRKIEKYNLKSVVVNNTEIPLSKSFSDNLNN